MRIGYKIIHSRACFQNNTKYFDFDSGFQEMNWTFYNETMGAYHAAVRTISQSGGFEYEMSLFLEIFQQSMATVYHDIYILFDLTRQI